MSLKMGPENNIDDKISEFNMATSEKSTVSTFLLKRGVLFQCKYKMFVTSVALERTK